MNGVSELAPWHSTGHCHFVAKTIDPRAYIRAAAFGQGVPATSFVGSSMPCYDANTENLVPRFDPEAATRLLGRAGWRPGPGGHLTKDDEPLKVKILGFSLQNSGPEYLQSALNAVGVQATVTNVDLNTWIEKLASQDFDITAFSTGGLPLSPENVAVQLVGLPPPRGQNFGAVDNPAFERAAAAAEAATTDAQSCAAWAKAQRALLEQSNVLPLMDQRVNYFGRRVKFDVLNALMVDPLSIRRTR